MLTGVPQPAKDRQTLQIVDSVTEMLPPGTVEAIYAASAALPPLSEPASIAKKFADLYTHTRNEPGAIMTIASVASEPVGFAYGHHWSWNRATDAWSAQLRDRLGEQAADSIDNSFAVELLAVTPAASGAGIGRQLLNSLLQTSRTSTAWLQTTDIESPARHLYLSTGWRTLGHGPDAPNGKPGLVMIHRSMAARRPGNPQQAQNRRRRWGHTS